MTEKDTGGPAFPRNYNADGHNGMTLRDFYAATIDIPWDAAAKHAHELKLKYANSASSYIGIVTTADIIAARAKLRMMEADAMLAAKGK